MIKISIPIAAAKAASYAQFVSAAGACPVVVDISAQADDFDGLLLPGGGDVNPVRYGQSINGSNPPDDELDALQFALTERFVAAAKPVLGICRGHQLLNVFFGGTLIQDLPNASEHALHRDENNHHTVIADKDSFLYGLYGERFVTNTFHHQGVDRPGEGIKVCATALDGTVEGIYHTSLPIWGVQFHPERMGVEDLPKDLAEGQRIAKLFIEACAAKKQN